MQAAESTSFKNKTERAVYSANIWLSHPTLLKTIMENDLSVVIYETHMRNVALLKKIYQIQFDDEDQLDYFVSALSSIICGSLAVYFKHGETEPVEEVYKIICKCINIMAGSFN